MTYDYDLNLLSDKQRDTDLKELAFWLQTIVDNPSEYLILDSETTGLVDCEIIELAVIDLYGHPILNQRIKPKGNITRGAYECHGIRLRDLKASPTFPEVFPKLLDLIKGKTLLIYNARFDLEAIASSLNHWGISYNLKIPSECVMLKYATFWGDWSNRHGSYTWRKLPRGDHSALGDCFAVLRVVSNMSKALKAELGGLTPPAVWCELFPNQIDPDIPF